MADSHCHSADSSDGRMDMSALVGALVRASEKAAALARACRAEEELFSLLVEEKGEADKNPRFLRDFKTLADVLIQEMVRHDLSQLDSGFGARVKGEESNQFTNGLGETICVEVCPTPEETAELLARVLDGNREAAGKLARVVHSDIDSPEEVCLPNAGKIDLGNHGVWIDPIDSTSEYIGGHWGEEDGSGLVPSGLQCVCVLIGVHTLAEGAPVVGVVNQPFHHLDHRGRPVGRCYWAVASVPSPVMSRSITRDEDKAASQRHRPIVLLSVGESEAVIEMLQNKGFEVKFAAGAGYKLLCVVLQRVDVYLLSKGTTFRWDTCAPHALLAARDIPLHRFRDISLSVTALSSTPEVGALNYAQPDGVLERLGPSAKWRNSGCLFACLNPVHAAAVDDILRTLAVAALSDLA